MNSFEFTDYDEGGEKVGPQGDYRLVCNAKSGEKLAIFGRSANRKNIDAVLAVGLPCVVRCQTRKPSRYAHDRFGHTHWVSQNSRLVATPKRDCQAEE